MTTKQKEALKAGTYWVKYEHDTNWSIDQWMGGKWRCNRSIFEYGIIGEEITEPPFKVGDIVELSDRFKHPDDIDIPEGTLGVIMQRGCGLFGEYTFQTAVDSRHRHMNLPMSKLKKSDKRSNEIPARVALTVLKHFSSALKRDYDGSILEEFTNAFPHNTW